MFKKNFVAASIISLIQSVIALLINCFAIYIFGLVSALVKSFGGDSKFIIDLILVLMILSLILSVIIFVFSIVILVKNKKHDEFLKIKKAIVSFLVVLIIIFIVNVVLAVLIQASTMWLLYGILALIHMIEIILILVGIKKNKINLEFENKQIV